MSTLCVELLPLSLPSVTPKPGPYSPRYAVAHAPLLSVRLNAVAFTDSPFTVNVRVLPVVPDDAVLPLNLKVVSSHTHN